jgi:hypothetical protein
MQFALMAGTSIVSGELQGIGAVVYIDTACMLCLCEDHRIRRTLRAP